MLTVSKAPGVQDRAFRLQPELVHVRAGPSLAVVAEFLVAAVPAVLGLLQQRVSINAGVHDRLHAAQVHRRRRGGLVRRRWGLGERGAAGAKPYCADSRSKSGCAHQATSTVRNMPSSMW